MSGDGHPLNGVIPFRIGGDQEPATAAPAKAQAPPQSSTSTTTAIGLGIVPVVLLAVLLAWRLTHKDTKEEHE